MPPGQSTGRTLGISSAPSPPGAALPRHPARPKTGPEQGLRERPPRCGGRQARDPGARDALMLPQVRGCTPPPQPESPPRAWSRCARTWVSCIAAVRAHTATASVSLCYPTERHTMQQLPRRHFRARRALTTARTPGDRKKKERAAAQPPPQPNETGARTHARAARDDQRIEDVEEGQPAHTTATKNVDHEKGSVR